MNKMTDSPLLNIVNPSSRSTELGFLIVILAFVVVMGAGFFLLIFDWATLLTVSSYEF